MRTEYLDELKMDKKLKLWHPTKNVGLSPSDVTMGSHRQIWWQCEKGHNWRAKAYSVLSGGCGCPYCKGLKPVKGETDLASLLPNVAKLWHPSLNGALTPRDVSPGSHKKIWCQCEKGHIWEAKIFSVAMEGCGCPYCMGKKAIPGETDIITRCPEVAAQWDVEKNGDLDPQTILPSSHEKVWWKCDLGHSWQAMPYSRTKEKGAGCPYCTGRKVLPGFNDLAMLRPWLAEEWHQSLNGELTPDKVTLGSNKKVWWQCSEGHTWQAFVYARAKKNGTGCPVCAGQIKQRRNNVVDIQQQLRKRTQSRKAVEKAASGIHI